MDIKRKRGVGRDDGGARTGSRGRWMGVRVKR